MQLEPAKPLPFTSEDWDNLRYLFQNSLMKGTNLAKLAQNLGTKWPIRAREETPEKYIDMTLEDLQELPEFYGKGNRLPLLYMILKDTQAMDDPFMDMTNHFDKVAEQENEAMLSLERYGIPEDFPIALVNFSDETKALCRLEKYATIGEFVDFAQRSAQSTIISGDYRVFLNALIMHDTETLATFVPIREGTTGVYLVEAIGIISRQLTTVEAATLLSAFQIPTTNPNWEAKLALPKVEALELIEEMKSRVLPYFDAMPDQAQQLRATIKSKDNSGSCCFVSMCDPHTEALSLAVAMAALGMSPKFKGFFGRLVK
ncbi:MAG: hypothetical protein AB3N63_17675 [Puniceicoccaceae bacterium]